MKIDYIKCNSFFRSCGRIAAAVLVIILIVLTGYWLWSPGRNSLPMETRHLKNGIWLRHGWFADDAYFRRNPDQDAAAFRGAPAAENLMRQLKVRHIHYVYPHLCPAQPRGEIPDHDDAQIGVFLDAAEKYDIQVIPWIGGVLDESARIHDPSWRKSFCASVAKMLKKHPRLAGVQVNVEPLPDGDAAFLELLAELKQVLPGQILSVAAYPPIGK